MRNHLTWMAAALWACAGCQGQWTEDVVSYEHRLSSLDMAIGFDNVADADRVLRMDASLVNAEMSVLKSLEAEKRRPLHKAAERDRLTIARLLVDHGAEVNARTSLGKAPLHLAAAEGHKSMVLFLLASGADADGMTVSPAATPLHDAILGGHAAIAEILAQEGATIDIFAAAGLGKTDILADILRKDSEAAKRANQDKNTPLHFAAAGGQVAAARLLIEAGANVNAVGKEGWAVTPLMAAVHHHRTEMTSFLLAQHAAPNQPDEDSACALLSAAAPELVGMLVKAGANPNRVGLYGHSPLHDAVWWKDKEKVAALIAAGADLNIRTEPYDGRVAIMNPVGPHIELDPCCPPMLDDRYAQEADWTALHLAIGEDQPEIAKMLIAAGADVNAKAPGRPAPLHLAAGKGSSELVRMLLAAKADISAKDGRGATELHWATKPEVARLLLAGGSAVNAADDRGMSPLHCAAFHKNKALIEVLVEAGGDVNALTRFRQTPLNIAVRFAPTEVISYLLARKATYNSADAAGSEGLQMIHAAASAGQAGTVALCLARGDDPNAQTGPGAKPYRRGEGRTPLHLAGNADVTAVLLKAGAKVEARDRDSETALHWAARRGDVEQVKLLLACKANPNAKDKDGATALCSARRAEVAVPLIQAGAEVNVKDDLGKTPLHKAVWEGDLEYVKLLVTAGADLTARNMVDKTPLAEARSPYREKIATFLVLHGAR